MNTITHLNYGFIFLKAMDDKIFVPIKLDNVGHLAISVAHQDNEFIKLTNISTKKKLYCVVLLKACPKTFYISPTPKVQTILPGIFVKTKMAMCHVILENMPIEDAEHVIIDSKMQFKTVEITKTKFLVYEHLELKNHFAIRTTYAGNLYEVCHWNNNFEDHDPPYENIVCTKCSSYSSMLFSNQTGQYCPECADDITKFSGGKYFYNELEGEFKKRIDKHPIPLKNACKNCIVDVNDRLYVPINKIEDHDSPYENIEVIDLNPYYKEYKQKKLTICDYIFI